MLIFFSFPLCPILLQKKGMGGRGRKGGGGGGGGELNSNTLDPSRLWSVGPV